MPPRTPVPQLILPKNFRLSKNERAVCARLVRVLREGDYWIAPFIEWLLSTDASEIDRVGVSEVVKEIARHGSEGTLDWLKKFKAAHAAVFTNSASSSSRTGGATFIDIPDDEEEQFYQLLKQWRLTYPEPPKRPDFPKGQTQHQMDPDSD